MLPDAPVVVHPVFRWLILATGDLAAANQLFWRGFHAAESRLLSARDPERQRDLLAATCRPYLDAWKLRDIRAQPAATPLPPAIDQLAKLAPACRALHAWFLVCQIENRSFHNPFGENPAVTAAKLAESREALATSLDTEAPGRTPPDTEPDLQWVPGEDTDENRKNFPEAWEDLDQSEPLRIWLEKRVRFDRALQQVATKMEIPEPNPEAAAAMPPPKRERRQHLIGIASVASALLLILIVLGMVLLKRARTVQAAPEVARIVQLSFPVDPAKFTPTDGTMAEIADLIFLRIGSDRAEIDTELLNQKVESYRIFEIEGAPIVDVRLVEPPDTHLFLFSAEAMEIKAPEAETRWQLLDANDMVFGLHLRDDLAHLIIRPGSREALTDYIESLNQR